jgi:hypothetical protein
MVKPSDFMITIAGLEYAVDTPASRGEWRKGVRRQTDDGVGVEAPTAAATGCTGPEAVDKSYTFDLDQVVRMFRPRAARAVSTRTPWAQLESEVM